MEPINNFLKKNSYIYQDAGVSEVSLLHTKSMLQNVLQIPAANVQTICAKGVIDGSWTGDAGIFIMPGGADLLYVRKLKGEALGFHELID